MKKVKSNKLGRRILSFVLTVALMVGLMPGNILTVSAEGTDTIISDELIVESVSSNDASATTECTCGTDDPAIHATTCAVYVAPENPVCSCAEACGVETQNFWCDVCGFDYAKCTGTDTAVVYTEGDKVSVTINGETTYYTSIKDAVAKANESGNATITLLQDTTTGERLDITNSATLDLNGNTLSCTAYFADDYETMVAITTNNTKLTIIDSVGGGKLDGTGTDYALMLGEPGAYTARSASAYIDGCTVSGSVKTVSGTSMTVSGSTVESNSVVATIDMTNETTLNVFNSQILNTHSSSAASAIDNIGTLTITDSTISGSIGVDNRGTANISGNTNITGTVCSVKSRVESQDSTLTITGGNYTGGINITGGTATISGGSYTGDIVVSGGTATISGGTITASSAENAVEVFDSAELTISGGTFSAIAGKTYDTGVYVHDGGTVKITGGTITSTAYGVYNERGSATITGGSISGGTVDLYVGVSDSILNLTLDEVKTEGATFPGGITVVSTTLAELLATEVATYWGKVEDKDTMLTVADDATSITDKGDITIRAICDHKDVKLDYITTETTHTPVCSVCNWTIGEATEHTGGTATCQDPAVCEACGVSYGDKDANIHTPTEGTIFTDNGDGTHSYTCACGAAVAEVPHTLDVTTGKCSACGADASIATVTDGTNTCYAADAATLNQAVTAILETGSRTFTVELPVDAEAGMITAIRRAICDTEGVADGSIHLTLKGVTTIPGTTNWDGVAFGPGDIYDEAGEIVDQELVTQLASINLPDVTEIGAQAFYFCENLVSVSAPKAQTIGAQAFGYTALTSVEFPELTTIPTDMFSGTWTLSSAKFPKVTTIEQGGLLVGAKFTTENNPMPFPLELTAAGNITFNGSNHFNIASQNYSGKVDLVLCCDKKDAVTFHDDGTATWQVREDLSYTFKSITFKHSYVDGKCEDCGEDCAHTGGTATCTTLAVCESCGASYGEVGGHSPNAAGYTVNADGTHSYTCSSCGNPFTESHTFTDGACTGCGVIGGYCGEEGNEQNVIWTYANGTLTISGTGAIADQRDNYDNRPWEEYVDQITTIVVNDGITSIGEAAFWRFQKLTTAKLPDSLTTISQQAFYGCTALKTVNFPANLKTIEGWAFLGCALESVTLPEGLTTIGYRAFSECKNLTSVTVPASVTTIDEGAFGYSPAKITVAEDNPNYSSDEHGVLFDKDKTTLIYCRPNIEVETYTIPSTVTEICKEAFYGCENLATITIPDGVQKIGSSAFGGCEALTTITIPAGVTTIEANTFYDCTALTAVTIPAGVTTIDMWAFSGCTALTTVTIPASVTSIAYNAFSNCSALTTVNVPCTWDGSLYTFDEGVTVNKVHNWVGGACTVCGVSCDHIDSAHTTATNNGNGTHSFTCTVCNSVAIQECTDEYSVVENKITKKCTACGEKGYIIITAEGGIYDGTTAYGATVEKTGIFENEEVIVNYYQGDTLIGTDAPVNAGTYTAKITYEEEVTVYDEFEITKANTVITWNDQTLASTGEEAELTAPTLTFIGNDNPEVVLAYSYKVQGDAEYTAGLPSDCGIYDVKVNVSETDNYNAVEDTIILTITCTPNADDGDCTTAITCSVCGKVTTEAGHVDANSDGKCDVCGLFTDGIGANLAGYTISLNGNIGVNFYMELDTEVVGDTGAYMLFTLPNGDTEQVAIADATQNTTLVEGKTYYIFSCEVASYEMAQSIKAQMFDGNGNGGKEYSYTVRDYAEYIINNTASYSTDDVAFAKALLNYGACSQTYFEVETGNLANKNLDEADQTVTTLIASDLETYKVSATSNELGTFAGYSLTLKSETTLKAYFKPAEGVDVSNLTFTANGQTVTPTKSGDYYVLSLENIKAWDLDTSYAFKVSNGSVELEFSCSALSYGYSVLNKGNSTYPDTLIQLISALRVYQQKSEVYVSGNN
ncbi:MAG: leucine-rich repeat protein [Lachnospiraceae bacterium]|nr:leucine-rich repeat protein [Lachnospiraceae bacterium]